MPFSRDDLPKADLARIFPGIVSPEADALRAEIEEQVTSFHKRYNGKVAGLSGRELAAAIESYDEISSRQTLFSSYLMLLESSGDKREPPAEVQAVQQWLGQIDQALLFFKSEIGAMKELDLLPMLSEPDLARHASWLAGVRSLYKHGTSEDIAVYYQDHARASRSAWVRLYHETLGGMRFRLADGQQEHFDAFEIRTQGSDSHERAAARAEGGRVLKENAKKMAAILNVLIKDKQVADEARGFERVDGETNLLNRIDDEIVDAMVKEVTASFPRLSHRFFDLERRAREISEKQGLSKTFNDESADEDQLISWGRAKGYVTRAFNKFSPRFARIARSFFSGGYIDAAPAEGKYSGAFTLSSGKYGHPYIFMHYNGDLSDVVVLAHELGHGIHDRLAEKKNGALGSDMTTALAEIPSTFAEMILLGDMIRREKDPEARLSLMQYRLENAIEAVHREVSYYNFERRLHEARKEGELSAEEISDIWIETRRDYKGPTAVFDDYDRYSWMAVTHFFDSPFYVYSYAVAQLCVAALYNEHWKDPDSKEFKEKFITMLEAGSTQNLDHHMKEFGFDLKDPSFWKGGLDLMEAYLNRIESGIMPEKPHADHCREDTKPPRPPTGAGFRRR